MVNDNCGDFPAGRIGRNLNKKWFFCNYGELEVSGISYTLFGVSSIETKYSSAIAGWHSVKYDVQYAYFLTFEGQDFLKRGRKSGEHIIFD